MRQKYPCQQILPSYPLEAQTHYIFRMSYSNRWVGDTGKLLNFLLRLIIVAIILVAFYNVDSGS